jgi:hypothetical protein
VGGGCRREMLGGEGCCVVGPEATGVGAAFL